MRRVILYSILVLFYLNALGSPQKVYRAHGKYLDVVSGNSKNTCLLDKEASYAVESFDKSAVILSERGYVPAADLDHCEQNVPVHVFLIPPGVEVLADINLNKKLYVAVDFVAVSPVGYLATVARLNSAKNLVTADGAYVPGRKLSDLQMHAFGGSGDAGSAVISPDGRYVAPAGQFDCSMDASPGVWDIEKNKKVITDEESCSALFSVKGGK